MTKKIMTVNLRQPRLGASSIHLSVDHTLATCYATKKARLKSTCTERSTAHVHDRKQKPFNVLLIFNLLQRKGYGNEQLMLNKEKRL